MAYAKILIADELLGDIEIISKVQGFQNLGEFVRQAIRNELRKYNNDIAKAKAVTKGAGVKLPDSQEVMAGKKAYKLLRAMLGSRTASSPNKDWLGFEGKLETALKAHDWKQLKEWVDRDVLVVKRREPEEEKWVMEQLGWAG